MGELRPRQVWGAGVLVAALALVGIVVVAAEGQPLVGPESSDSLELASGWRWLFAALVALALLGGLLVLVLSVLTHQRRKTPVWRTRNTWLVWLIALMLGFVAFVVLRPNDHRADRPPTEEGSGAAAEEETGDHRSPPPPWALLALGGVVVGALVGAAALGRRMDRTTDDGDDPTGVVTAALDRSVAELEQGGDARAAVVAAYARLLEAFDRCGVGRRPAETPLEHLRRGLAAVAIRPEPAQELTELFLEARFSTHPMGEHERERALAAFRRARDELAATVEVA